MILWIDMWWNTGICIKEKEKYYYWTLKKVDNKNIINKICEFMLDKLWYVDIDSVEMISTFLPNVFWGFFYKVLQKQLWLYWVLNHYFNTIIFKESWANKTVLWRSKSRKETIKERKAFTVKKINELWFKTDNHDSADWIKALLVYEKSLIKKPLTY